MPNPNKKLHFKYSAKVQGKFSCIDTGKKSKSTHKMFAQFELTKKINFSFFGIQWKISKTIVIGPMRDKMHEKNLSQHKKIFTNQNKNFARLLICNPNLILNVTTVFLN